ncbi:TAT-binding protein-like protein 7, AAA ATPase [Massospora cicadina]|nr:TAT-binding protein-like protein 7, AAA ATPase [Massospora cicadina]
MAPGCASNPSSPAANNERSLRSHNLRPRPSVNSRYATRSSCPYLKSVSPDSNGANSDGSQPNPFKPSAGRGTQRHRASSHQETLKSDIHSDNEAPRCSPGQTSDDDFQALHTTNSRRRAEKVERLDTTALKRTSRSNPNSPTPQGLSVEVKPLIDPTYLPSNCAQVLPSRTEIKLPQSVVLPSMSFAAKLEDVGGLSKQINRVKESIVLPLLYPKFCASYNITSSRGILFYGPPGTGKTLLARALAHECSDEAMPIAFFHFNSADILSKWVGEAESRIRAIFEAARVWQPSLLFFDEIDGLAPARIDNDRPSASLVSALLASIDGFTNLGRVLVVGSTNRLDAIDPALRRPGRFDQELLFPLPTESARKDILEITTRKWNQSLSLSSDRLAKLTSGFCGADLSLLCSKAAKHAFNRTYPHALDSSVPVSVDISEVKVQATDFLACLPQITPSAQTLLNMDLQPVTGPFSELLAPVVDRITSCIKRTPRACLGQNYSPPKVLLVVGCYPVATHRVLSASLHALDCHKITILDLTVLATPDDLSGCKELNRLLSSDGAASQAELFVIPDAATFLADNSALFNIIRSALLRPVTGGNRCFLFQCARACDLQDLLAGLRVETIKVDLPSTSTLVAFFDRCLEYFMDMRISDLTLRQRCLDLLVEAVHGWPIDHILQLLFLLDMGSRDSYPELYDCIQRVSADFTPTEHDETEYVEL